MAKVYQLWVINGAPVESGGVFTMDATGAGTVTAPPSAAPALPDAIAVSLEPAGGVPAQDGGDCAARVKCAVAAPINFELRTSNFEL